MGCRSFRESERRLESGRARVKRECFCTSVSNTPFAKSPRSKLELRSPQIQVQVQAECPTVLPRAVECDLSIQGCRRRWLRRDLRWPGHACAKCRRGQCYS